MVLLVDTTSLYSEIRVSCDAAVVIAGGQESMSMSMPIEAAIMVQFDTADIFVVIIFFYVLLL